MLNYSHVNTQYPTNEQAAHGHYKDVFCSHKAKDGRFYVVALPLTPLVSKPTGVRHPLTNQLLAFPSRRAANAYCDLLNSQLS